MQEHPLLCTQRSKLKALQWPGISPRQASSPAYTDFVRCEQFGSEVHLPHPCALLTLTQISHTAMRRAKLWAQAVPADLCPRKVPGMQRTHFMG